jgi:hypothetical protein
VKKLPGASFRRARRSSDRSCVLLRFLQQRPSPFLLLRASALRLAVSPMSQQHAAAAARRKRAAPSSSPSAGAQAAGARSIGSPQLRSLLQGLPDRAHALAQQKSNLDRFLREHEREFAALPYHPWTKQRGGFEVKVDITSSSLPGCEGFRGVMLRHEHVTGTKKKPLLFYPGMLMTETLFSQFSEEYYCPTALELPALAWKNPAGELQRFLIVGDPTSAGAIINDGPFSHCAGQTLTRLLQLPSCATLSDLDSLSALLVLSVSQLLFGVGEETSREARAVAPGQARQDYGVC